MIPGLSTHYGRARFSHGILWYLGFIILFITACVLPLQPTTIVITATPPSSTDTPIVTTDTLSASTETSIPSATIEPVRITATTAPSCTVLQDLNLRSGPGRAYDPPIGSLLAGTKFVPIGFYPQGIPGGPWVQAQVEGTISSQTGWVSAGSQYVACNLELATLPAVEVPPPPPTEIPPPTACPVCDPVPACPGQYDPCSCQCVGN